MVAGLAAGGLGAAIKYAPKRHVDPFATATSEDPGDVMPDDDPLPAWAAGQGAGGTAEEEASVPPEASEVRDGRADGTGRRRGRSRGTAGRRSAMRC